MDNNTHDGGFKLSLPHFSSREIRCGVMVLG